MPGTSGYTCKKNSTWISFFFQNGRPGYLPFLLVGFLIPLIAGCNSSESKTFDTPQGRQLLEQLKSSSEEIQSYSKEFEDLKASDATVERISYTDQDLKPDSLSERLKKDLSYLFDVYYKDKSVVDLVDTSRVNDTLIVSVKEGYEKKSKLQSQKILQNKDGKLLFASSRLNSSNWLYDLSISIEVEFDSLLRYHRHRLNLLNEVHLLNQSIESNVRGQASY